MLVICSSSWAQLPLSLPLPLPGVGGSGPTPQPYGANDGGGFRNVLPPGENGFDNAAQLGAFEAGGTRPAPNNEPPRMYSHPPYALPRLTPGHIPDYIKDA